MPEVEAIYREADKDQRRIYWEAIDEDRPPDEDLDAPMSDKLIQWILENF